MEMKTDTPLDRVVFQLTPTRERCEVIAAAGDETEKVADGSIEPFLKYIEEANDQFETGKDTIELHATASDAAAWFTRGTLERFVTLVTDPEILEDVCNIHGELLQLEETSRCMKEDLSGSTTTSDSVSNRETDDSELSLKKQEAHREALYNKQSEAFSRATVAGFDVESMPSLIRFCTVYGVDSLLDLCNRYVKICMKIRTMEIWLGEMVARAEEKLNRATMEDKETPVSAGPCNEDVANGGGQQNDGDRRLSVQEKIIMFEGKTDAGKRRRSAADAGKTEVNKPVLRRWSLAVEKIVASSAEASSSDGLSEKNILEVDEEVYVDSEKEQAVESSKPGSLADGNEEEHKNEDQAGGTQPLDDTKGRLYEQYQEKRDAKLKELSISMKAERQARLRAMQESLERRRAEVAKNLKSRKTDPLVEAKLRAEKLRAFKAELKKIKEEEERKRLEDIRSQKLQRKLSTPSSPRSGASTPRQQPVRGKSTMKGPVPTFQRASTYATNVTNSRTRKSTEVFVPPVELKQVNRMARVSLEPIKAGAVGKGKTLTNNKEAGNNRSKNTVRKSAPALVSRRGGQARVLGIGASDVAGVEDVKEIVVASVENGSSVERMAIRAPLTTEDESELVEDENGEESADSDEGIAISSSLVVAV